MNKGEMAAPLLAGWLLFAPLAQAQTSVPPLLLAENYRQELDPAAYWVSEKLDGVRAYWDGERLWSRGGRPIAAPAWFLAALPRRPLDGELWIGRGRFEEVSGIVRKQTPVEEEWRRVKYLVFELPGAAGDFSARLRQLDELIRAAGQEHVQVVEQFRVADRGELERRLAAALGAGGEGLMLHRADAPYRVGRDQALLKLKPWDDAEAVVIAHQPGQGRHQGRLGALRVRLADGREISVGGGFSDAQREHPPAVGELITLRHNGFTASGLPRFPRFLRVRAEGL